MTDFELLYLVITD